MFSNKLPPAVQRLHRVMISMLSLGQELLKACTLGCHGPLPGSQPAITCKCHQRNSRLCCTASLIILVTSTPCLTSAMPSATTHLVHPANTHITCFIHWVPKPFFVQLLPSYYHFYPITITSHQCFIFAT